MKSLKKIASAALLFGLTRTAVAMPLADAAIVQGEKIGIFLATFDPPSASHEQVIQQALAEKKFSKIVVLPTDFTPHKPLRTATEARHQMLEAAFREHSDVLTIPAFHYGYPQSRGVIAYLKNNFAAECIAVALREDLSAVVNRAVISWLLPVEQRLTLAEPQGALKSSVVRKYFKNHPEFFTASDEELAAISSEDLPVALPVRKIIRDNKVYSGLPTVLGFARDFVSSLPSMLF